jgi:hypothetical protein
MYRRIGILQKAVIGFNKVIITFDSCDACAETSPLLWKKWCDTTV